MELCKSAQAMDKPSANIVLESVTVCASSLRHRLGDACAVELKSRLFVAAATPLRVSLRVGSVSWGAFLNAGEGYRSRMGGGTFPPVMAGADNLTNILFSSGTTAKVTTWTADQLSERDPSRACGRRNHQQTSPRRFEAASEY